ncbi:MAG TPA: DnaB-like helicase C-terminal domain-containing protein, partial [Candidatus Paceibacterota bacterium]
RLSDLRDSGSIEQDADVVMFIHRDDKMNDESDRPNIAEIMVEKHRNGPVGSIELFFNDKQTTFQDLAKANMSDFGAGALDNF